MRRALRMLSIFAGAFFALYSSAGVLFAQDGLSVAERKQQLEAELKKIEQEMEGQKVIIAEKQREGVTLERDISILDAKIKKADLSIKARDIAISKISSEVKSRSDMIDSLSEKLDREKQSLAQLIRRTNELDGYSLPEVIFSNQGLSEFFSDLDSFDSIKAELQISAETIKTMRDETKEEKEKLELERGEEEILRKAQALERGQINGNRSEKNQILKQTKGQEAAYQKLLKNKEKDAAKIRSELFTLSGSAAIPFGKALEYAKQASAKTGVRPALILGIIAEESNLGQNVGKGHWETDMHPTRDRPIFEKITAKLGLNPDTLPVSKKVWYGWGGAMGPAQFIPSTWVLFEDKVAELTGHNPPNPWDPEDAFMASAILLKDSGAAAQTYKAEFRAAMCYLAGCGNVNKASLQFYGEDVMALAAKYQKQIDILDGQ